MTGDHVTKKQKYKKLSLRDVGEILTENLALDIPRAPSLIPNTKEAVPRTCTYCHTILRYA